MIVAAAIRPPQLVEPSPMKLNEAAISVFVCELLSTSENRKKFHEKTKARIADTASPDDTSGRAIRRKMRKGEQPSTCAASKIERGILSK